MPRSPFQRLFSELKRRKVFRAAGAYLVMAWVAIEVAGTVAPLMELPEWVPRLVLLLLILGFPVAVGMAWAVDMTEAGLEWTPEAEGDDEAAPPAVAPRANRIAATVLVSVGALAAALAGVWYLTGGGPPPHADHSIAVLPFATLGTEQSSAFTEGVQSGILTRLSNVADLDVISRTSVMSYRAKEVPVSQIARELGVEWVVRGDVQEVGDQVLVNVRLVDARRDRTVWAEAFEEELTAENVFQIQSRIATSIIDELEARLTVGEERRVERAPTGSLEAYRLYVQGRSHLEDRTEEGMRRSLDFFERAIAEDSTYALAWVGFADALVLLVDYGYAGDETLPAAEEAVDRALELDPRSAEAHASLGLLYWARDQAGGAIRALERAVDLRPSYAEAHNWLAWMHLVLGHGDRVVRWAERAVQLDPLAPEPVSNLSWGHLVQGQLADALVEARRVQELAPTFPSGYFLEGLALYEMERPAAARQVLRGLSVPWAGSGPLLTLALTYVATGDPGAARAIRTERAAASDHFAVGVIDAALGDIEAAFAAFDRVGDWGAYWPSLASHYLYREVLAPVRADPRFRIILRRIDEAWSQG